MNIKIVVVQRVAYANSSDMNKITKTTLRSNPSGLCKHAKCYRKWHDIT